MKNFKQDLIDALTEGSRGLQRLKRKGDSEGAERKEKEGKIRKLATEFEGHAVGSRVDDLAGLSAPKKGESSTEHIRGHKARGVRADDNPSFGKATSRPETVPGRRAARRAVARSAGESEVKRRAIGHEAMDAEKDRRQRAAQVGESFEQRLIKVLYEGLSKSDREMDSAAKRRKATEAFQSGEITQKAFDAMMSKINARNPLEWRGKSDGDSDETPTRKIK